MYSTDSRITEQLIWHTYGNFPTNSDEHWWNATTFFGTNASDENSWIRLSIAIEGINWGAGSGVVVSNPIYFELIEVSGEVNGTLGGKIVEFTANNTGYNTAPMLGGMVLITSTKNESWGSLSNVTLSPYFAKDIIGMRYPGSLNLYAELNTSKANIDHFFSFPAQTMFALENTSSPSSTDNTLVFAAHIMGFSSPVYCQITINATDIYNNEPL